MKNNGGFNADIDDKIKRAEAELRKLKAEKKKTISSKYNETLKLARSYFLGKAFIISDEHESMDGSPCMTVKLVFFSEVSNDNVKNLSSTSVYVKTDSIDIYYKDPGNPLVNDRDISFVEGETTSKHFDDLKIQYNQELDLELYQRIKALTISTIGDIYRSLESAINENQS